MKTVDLTGKKFQKWTVICRSKSKRTEATWVCRCSCGTEKVYSSNYFRKVLKSPDCGCSRNLSGKKFGRLLAVEKIGHRANSFCSYRCKCDCGKEVSVRTSYLMDGHRSSCGCAKLKSVEETGPVTLRNYYRQNAKKRDLVFELTVDECKRLFSSECNYCNKGPSSKISLHKASSVAQRFFVYNGIDRVDNDKGYVVENCVPCCEICNMMKRELSIENWMAHMKLVLENFRKSM